jgi:hypothetical protein
MALPSQGHYGFPSFPVVVWLFWFWFQTDILVYKAKS